MRTQSRVECATPLILPALQLAQTTMTAARCRMRNGPQSSSTSSAGRTSSRQGLRCRGRLPAIPLQTPLRNGALCAGRGSGGSDLLEAAAALLMSWACGRASPGATVMNPAGCHRGVGAPPGTRDGGPRCCKALRQRWHDAPIMVGLWNVAGRCGSVPAAAGGRRSVRDLHQLCRMHCPAQIHFIPAANGRFGCRRAGSNCNDVNGSPHGALAMP